eukprot:TRINITY_DN67895_c0_g1_i1.p1 TRINITY_DN67895_c0_g1~~TRINITY_DN67895_c0_g1_i1.p1  ORF type:complete len:530 (-),score=105.25 TRINITY_DN67895_c0_g1_i1:32-1621(-)
MSLSAGPTMESVDFFDRMANFQRNLQGLKPKRPSQVGSNRVPLQDTQPVPLALASQTPTTPVRNLKERAVMEANTPSRGSGQHGVIAASAPAALKAVQDSDRMSVSDGTPVADSMNTSGSAHNREETRTGFPQMARPERDTFFYAESAYGMGNSKFDDQSDQAASRGRDVHVHSTTPQTARSQSSQLTAATSSAVGALLKRGPSGASGVSAGTLEGRMRQRRSSEFADANARLKFESGGLHGSTVVTSSPMMASTTATLPEIREDLSGPGVDDSTGGGNFVGQLEQHLALGGKATGFVEADAQREFESRTRGGGYAMASAATVAVPEERTDLSDNVARNLAMASWRVEEVDQLATKHLDAEQLGEDFADYENKNLAMASRRAEEADQQVAEKQFCAEPPAEFHDVAATAATCAEWDMLALQQQLPAAHEAVKRSSGCGRVLLGGTPQSGGDEEDASANISGEQITSIAPAARLERRNANRVSEDEVADDGENVFRSGTLWLWNREMANLDADIAEMLVKRPARRSARRR